MVLDSVLFGIVDMDVSDCDKYYFCIGEWGKFFVVALVFYVWYSYLGMGWNIYFWYVLYYDVLLDVGGYYYLGR